jgi:MerR family transcriptional regulator/heat shock protein HspR
MDTPRPPQLPGPDPERGVYGISVAADLVGSAPQNLRLYEARGLVRPARSQGGTRLYSDRNLERLREIGRLLASGLNLAGVASVLALQADNNALRAELEEARRPRAAAPKRSHEAPNARNQAETRSIPGGTER